jgi:hypothetical protein
LINQDSKFYLPKLIKEQEPSYDPFWTKSFPSPPREAMMPGSKAICSLVANARKPPINGAPTWGAEVTLYEACIKGLSNAEPNVPVVTDTRDGAIVSVVARFSVIHGMQPNITINGRFQLHQTCCIKDDEHVNNPCQADDPQFGADADGTFTGTIASSQVDIRATVGVKNDNSGLNIDITSLAVSANETPANVTVTVDITSMDPGPDRNTWNQYAAEAFEAPSSLRTMVAGLNQAVNSPDTRATLSKKLTDAVNAIIKSPEGARRFTALTTNAGPTIEP